jgi:hypothetical protein
MPYESIVLRYRNAGHVRADYGAAGMPIEAGRQSPRLPPLALGDLGRRRPRDVVSPASDERVDRACRNAGNDHDRYGRLQQHEHLGSARKR